MATEGVEPNNDSGYVAIKEIITTKILIIEALSVNMIFIKSLYGKG